MTGLGDQWIAQTAHGSGASGLVNETVSQITALALRQQRGSISFFGSASPESTSVSVLQQRKIANRFNAPC
ncbi:hypothetical protein BDW66DRAFT_136293 [Aspergillus desertorum]